MKIALINENSQHLKNNLIYESLKRSTNNEIINFGMEEGDNDLTYVQVGLLGAILINTRCVDFIVSGCGTGEGAMMSLNAFPNITCGLIETPLDAYLFSQINAGNAVSIPYAKKFGWGSEIQLDYIFEKLFANEFGKGYPKERSESEKKNREVLFKIKEVTHSKMVDILKNIDQNFLYETINRKKFLDYFLINSQDKEITEYIKTLINEKK